MVGGRGSMDGLACEPRADDQIDDPLTGVVTPPAREVQPGANDQFAQLAALTGGMQAAVTDQGEQLNATMKEGEVAQERRQEEFAGVVKEQFKVSAEDTKELVEGPRTEVAATTAAFPSISWTMPG